MADREPIPIIGGTGALGAGLATRWAQAGVPVVLGSRSAERAEEAAAKVRAAVPGADVSGLENGEANEVTVRADEKEFRATVRLDTPREREYLRHGGILPFVLRRLLSN